MTIGLSKTSKLKKSRYFFDTPCTCSKYTSTERVIICDIREHFAIYSPPTSSDIVFLRYSLLQGNFSCRDLPTVCVWRFWVKLKFRFFNLISVIVPLFCTYLQHYKRNSIFEFQRQIPHISPFEPDSKSEIFIY